MPRFFFQEIKTGFNMSKLVWEIVFIDDDVGEKRFYESFLTFAEAASWAYTKRNTLKPHSFKIKSVGRRS